MCRTQNKMDKSRNRTIQKKCKYCRNYFLAKTKYNKVCQKCLKQICIKKNQKLKNNEKLHSKRGNNVITTFAS